MLVLSRKNLQEIMIGDDVKITVLQVKGNTVRLGIEAPRNIRVRRGELEPEPEVVTEEVTFSLTNELVGDSDRRILPFQGEFEARQSFTNDLSPESGGRLGRIRDMLSRIRNGEGRRDQ